MGGGLESRCLSRVYGADGAVPYLAASSWHFTLFHEEDCQTTLNFLHIVNTEKKVSQLKNVIFVSYVKE